MKAAVFDGSELKISDVEKPAASKDESLIKVLKAGICGTDFSIVSGDFKVQPPLILGHEFVGEVEEPEERISGRVVSEINIPCGSCFFCSNGMPSHCLRRKALGITTDGAFAEYVKVPFKNLHVLPESVSTEEGVFVEPLAACIRSFELAPIKGKPTVAILGPGTVGLLTLQVARALSAGKIIVAGTRWDRLNLSKKLGADITINVKEEDLPKRIFEETNGVGADIVVEATGRPEGAGEALSIVRARGTVIMKTTSGLASVVDLSDLVRKEIAIQGSRCGPFDKAIEMLSRREVSVSPLITHRVKLDEINAAFEKIKKREAIKVLIEICDETKS